MKQMFVEVGAIIPLTEFVPEGDEHSNDEEKLYLNSMTHDYFVFAIPITHNVPVPLQVEIAMEEMGAESWEIISDVMLPLS